MVKILSAVAGLLASAIGMALLFAFPIMWVWNWLMPGAFGLPVLNFWQTVALIFLSRALFGGSNVSSK